MDGINRLLLTMPNTSWFGKRRWVTPPYTLGILSRVVPEPFATAILDPNLDDLSLEETIAWIDRYDPQVVGISCFSLEYAPSVERFVRAIRSSGAGRVVVLGGPYVTTSPELAMREAAVDFAILGEGEQRLPRLLTMLAAGAVDFSGFDGLAYRVGGEVRINPPVTFLNHLDDVPFPDYEKSRFRDYFRSGNAYGNVMNARHEPYAITSTSRGCPYPCIYCSTHAIDGSAIRFRSAENVLAEVDWLYHTYGVREILFLDDNLIFDRRRFRAILDGLVARRYDNLAWKSVNLATFLLTDELLERMWESGCYQLILPIESGNQWVLDTILKKPLKLDKVIPLVKKGRELGFEIASDFIIGSPGESWDQIRDSFRFAEEMDADMVSFHIATPLPRTEMYTLARDGGFLPPDFDFGQTEFFGFGRGCITSDEFRPQDLHMLRALEWDRINFKTPEKKARFARMAGITLEELERWRRNTIHNLGIYFPNAEGKEVADGDRPHLVPREGVLDKNGRFARVVNAS
ncbi:MAG: radical SAM protein [Magnetococcales bacterium]|nr:radical SAM protein [Magnetococcales bacterium]